jgi:hypothetical protein
VNCEPGRHVEFRVVFNHGHHDGDRSSVSKKSKAEAGGMLVDATNLLLEVDIEPVIAMA